MAHIGALIGVRTEIDRKGNTDLVVTEFAGLTGSARTISHSFSEVRELFTKTVNQYIALFPCTPRLSFLDFIKPYIVRLRTETLNLSDWR